LQNSINSLIYKHTWAAGSGFDAAFFDMADFGAGAFPVARALEKVLAVGGGDFLVLGGTLEH